MDEKTKEILNEFYGDIIDLNICDLEIENTLNLKTTLKSELLMLP